MRVAIARRQKSRKEGQLSVRRKKKKSELEILMSQFVLNKLGKKFFYVGFVKSFQNFPVFLLIFCFFFFFFYTKFLVTEKKKKILGLVNDFT